MSKGAIRLSHFVGVFLLFNIVPRVVVGIDDLGSESVFHRHAFSAAGSIDDPAEREALLTFKGNFDGNLVGRAANAATFHLEARARVLERAKEQVNGIALLELLGNFF